MTPQRIVAILLISIALLALGLALDLRGFLGNLIAGAIEILLTVTILGWLLQTRERRRWARARAQLTSAISYHLATIAHEFYGRLEADVMDELPMYQDIDGDIAEGYEIPSEPAAKAISSLAEVIRTTGYELLSREGAEDLHNSVKWDLGQIRNSLLPMIVSIGEEPKLAGLLSEIDAAARRWTTHFPLSDHDAGYHYIEVVSLMDAIARAYRYLVDTLPSDLRS